jgi:hypothetical protein
MEGRGRSGYNGVTTEPWVMVHILFLFVWWDWDLNSGLHPCKAGAVPLELHCQSIFLWLFWRWNLENYLPGLDGNHDPPNLSLSIDSTSGMSYQHLAQL